MSILNPAKYVQPYTQGERFAVRRRPQASVKAAPEPFLPPYMHIEDQAPTREEEEDPFWNPKQPDRPEYDDPVVQLRDPEEDLDQYDLLDEPKKDLIVNVIAPTSSTVLKKKNPSGRELRVPNVKRPPRKAPMDSLGSLQARVESPSAIAPPEEKVFSPTDLMPQPVKSQPNLLKSAAAPRPKAPSGPENRTPGLTNSLGLTPILKEDRAQIQPYAVKKASIKLDGPSILDIENQENDPYAFNAPKEDSAMPTLKSALKGHSKARRVQEDEDDLQFLGAANPQVKEPTILAPRAEATMPGFDEVKFVKSRQPAFPTGAALETPGPSRTTVRKYPTIPGTKTSSIIKSVP